MERGGGYKFQWQTAEPITVKREITVKLWPSSKAALWIAATLDHVGIL
jgi:hypothetical protein